MGTSDPMTELDSHPGVGPGASAPCCCAASCHPGRLPPQGTQHPGISLPFVVSVGRRCHGRGAVSARSSSASPTRNCALAGSCASKCECLCLERWVLSFSSHDHCSDVWLCTDCVSVTHVAPAFAPFQGDPCPHLHPRPHFPGLLQGELSQAVIRPFGSPALPCSETRATDHCSALSNRRPCQEGAAWRWQVPLVCRGQKASLSGRAGESGGPSLGLLLLRTP